MSKLFYILVAILMLGFIVTVHEFGHYIVGRLCGIGIVEFSVGFGPKIFGWKRKGIQYSLRAIPLGGFCSFVGEDENDSAPNAFNNVSVWKRFLTVLSGPAMNFLIAFLFCAILLSNFYVAEVQPRISEVYENTPAAEAGLEPGDVITVVNGTQVSYDGAGVELLRGEISSFDENSELVLDVKRGENVFQVQLTPAMVADEATGQSKVQIGVGFGGRTFTPGEALRLSSGYMVDFTKEMLTALKNLFFRGEGLENTMGPVGIIDFVSDLVYNQKLYAVVNLIFVLSLNIGIMNMLPIPGLDGARLIFLIVEAVRRKPIPPEKEGMVHGVGMLLLFAFMIFISYKDILRLFSGS